MFHLFLHFFPLQGMFDFVIFYNSSIILSHFNVVGTIWEWKLTNRLKVMCSILLHWIKDFWIWCYFQCFFGFKHYNCCSNVQCYLSCGVPTIALGVVVVYDVVPMLHMFFYCIWWNDIHAYLLLPLLLPLPNLDLVFLCDWWSMSITRDCNKETHNKEALNITMELGMMELGMMDYKFSTLLFKLVFC